MGIILEPWSWRSLVHDDMNAWEAAERKAAQWRGVDFWERSTSNPGRNFVDQLFPGIRAEVAAHELLGIPYDWTEYFQGDGGIDIVLVPGKATGQVKFTRHRGGKLLFRPWDKFKAHVAIFATPAVDLDDRGDIELRGWIRRPDFWRLQKERDFGGFTAPSVLVEQLEHMDKLAWIRERLLWEEALAAHRRGEIKFKQASLF